MDLRFRLADPELWSPQTPNLYLAHVVLSDEEGRDIDDLYETFGVRTIGMRGSHLYLNNQKVVPRGTHDLSNYHNESLICPSDRAIVMDILLHKRMNATCSRWPSDMRMHYDRIAQYADQLGFMISWTGYYEMWTVHPEMEMYARRDARAMVRSLRNHPSIVVWEMGDEPLMAIHHHRRFRWYQQIYDMVAEEDRSRPIVPAGSWCNELVELVTQHPRKELDAAARRSLVLQDYPVFTPELAVWDYHYCPYHPGTEYLPTHQVVDTVRHALGGERATIFTEFGIDGMPRFENVREIYGKFRWVGWGLMPLDRNRSDMRYFGKPVSQEDWRETQAAQAIVLAGIIGRLRENPEHFAGFYLVTLVDPWTFYWGVVDAAYNAKLAFFVARSCYGELYLSSLHGTVEVARADAGLTITASNLGPAVAGASLLVKVRDREDRVVNKLETGNLSIPGDGSVSRLAGLDLSVLPGGMYSIEHFLVAADGRELSRQVELFILTD